jgi:hypothetical protein
MSLRGAVLALLLAGLAAAPSSMAAPRLTPVGSFDQPVYAAAPPEDPHRLFVVEKAGMVKVMVDGGAPQVFLDIREEVDDDGEEGLLSIAFARDYATSRRFYAYFTAEDPAQGDGSRIKIVEFTRPEATPDAADPAARRTLVEIPHPTATNHNGGQLQTGPDGMVWAATGDGAVDPNDAQDPGTLLGKVLRIDPASGAPPQIWASGLRNPWRFSFDRATGDLTIGDVGAGTREEIDFAPSGTAAGSNYGWPCWEGTTGPKCVVASHTPPVFDYDSTSFGCGVVGGYVVRDPTLPTLAGRYLYADLCRSRLRSIALAQPSASDDREEELELGNMVAFGEDSCGHVYAVSIAGTVARVDDGPFTPCGGSPGGGDPGGGDPGGGPPADTLAPALEVSYARHQRLIAKRAAYLAARCDEDCGLTTEANARLRSAGRTRKWSFRPVIRLAPAGERPRLKLRLPKAMRDALARRVARGARPLVKAVVIARDAAGNETRRTVYVRVVG